MHLQRPRRQDQITRYYLPNPKTYAKSKHKQQLCCTMCFNHGLISPTSPTGIHDLLAAKDRQIVLKCKFQLALAAVWGRGVSVGDFFAHLWGFADISTPFVVFVFRLVFQSISSHTKPSTVQTLESSRAEVAVSQIQNPRYRTHEYHV